MRETVLASAAIVDLLKENFINTWILVEDVKVALKEEEEKGENKSRKHPFSNQLSSSSPLLTKALRICLDAWTFPVTSIIIDFTNEDQPVVVSTLNANELLEVEDMFHVNEAESVGEMTMEYAEQSDEFSRNGAERVDGSHLHGAKPFDSKERRKNGPSMIGADGSDTDNDRNVNNDRKTSLHLFYESLYNRGFQSPQEFKYHDFLESALKLVGNAGHFYSIFPEKGSDEL